MVEAVHSGERPVAMKGDGALFDGKIGAVATVMPSESQRLEDELDGNRRRRDSDGITEVYSTGFGDSEEEQKEAMKEYIRMAMARRAQGSPMPPVTLRVQFENRGAAPIEIEVTDVNSELGNFAVRPPKLTLAPGEKGTLDPMVSQLGVTSDEIPVKVSVRMGGKKETQTIAVKNIILPSVRNQ